MQRPSHSEIAKKLVQADAKIATLSSEVTRNQIFLDANQILLKYTVQDTDTARKQYNNTANIEDADPAPAQPEKRPNWLVRMIDNRVKLKFQRKLEAEINRLIKIRKEKMPNSTELDFAFIKETVIREHNNIQEEMESRIASRRKDLIINSSISLTVLVVVAILTGILGPFAAPGFAGLFLPGILTIMDVKTLVYDLPKEHATRLARNIAEVEEFAKSSETFDHQLDKHLEEAKKLLPQPKQKQTTAEVSANPAASHEESHSVAKNSIFAGSKTEASDEKKHTHHHRHHRR